MKKNNKELDLNFDLEGDKKEQRQKIDYLLEEKEFINTNNNDKKIWINPNLGAEMITQFKSKKEKVRIQSYITAELDYAIKTFKRNAKIKKDSDALEMLLRLALGLNQI